MFSYITLHSKFFSNISEAPSLIQKQMGISAHIWIMSFSTHLWASQVALCRNHKRLGFNPWVGKIPWRRAWQSAPVFLPGESHGQVSLAGYSSWGCKESDMTEVTYLHAHTHTHIWTDGQMDGGPSLGTLTCQALSRYWVYSREENVGI